MINFETVNKLDTSRLCLNSALKTCACLVFLVGIFVFFLSNNTYSQINLVPNGSFELIDTCPYAGSQLYFAKPWYAPQNNSTELIAKCAVGYPSVPCLNNVSCNYYFQYPKSGSNYTAIWTFQETNYREYLQVKLIDTLKQSKCYFVKFYTNMPNRATKYCTNSLGAYFSNKQDTQIAFWNGIDPTILPYKPQILKKGNPVLFDTLNWIPIAGIYVANGSESFLTIGCFTPDSLLDTLNVNPLGYGGGYYSIDEVSVFEASPQNMQKELALRDTILSLGDTIKIGDDEITSIQYAWFINGTFIDTTGILSIHPIYSTSYTRRMNWCNYTWYDTVTVSVSTGVEQLSAGSGQLVVYPNPAGNQLTVGGNQFSVNTIEVSNVLGQVCIIPPYQGGKGDVSINVAALPSGIYFIKATDTDGNVMNGKFVKQ